MPGIGRLRAEDPRDARFPLRALLADRRVKTCSACGGTGHNKRTCRAGGVVIVRTMSGERALSVPERETVVEAMKRLLVSLDRIEDAARALDHALRDADAPPALQVGLGQSAKALRYVRAYSLQVSDWAHGRAR